MHPIALQTIPEPDKKDFFIRLYEKHYSSMKYQAYLILQNLDDAEDAVQEALVRLIRNYGRLQELSGAHQINYIRQTVRCASIDALRIRGEHYYHAEEMLREIPDLETPERRFIYLEGWQEALQAISQLSDSWRDLLRFKFILGRSNKELAVTFQTSEENIRQMLSRIRRKLRDYLNGGKS